MTHYGMVVDLYRCIACNTCSIACKTQNVTPKGVFWRRVVQGEKGTYPQTKRAFASLACMQCRKAPCLNVCPTGATYRRADGIVAVNYSKCIGCKYCIAACPYDARNYVRSIEPYFDTGFTPLEKGSNQVAGVATKCTFCADKIDAGVASGLRPGVDADATPECVVSCPTGSLVFGDLDDPTSAVSRIVTSDNPIQLLAEAGTNPSVYYIPATRATLTEVEQH